MHSIATPMVGGMITAPLLSMRLIPAGYRMLERRRLRAGRPLGADPAATDATRNATQATP